MSHLLGLGQRLFDVGAGPGDDAAWYGFIDGARAPYSEPRLDLGSASPIKVLPKSGIGILQHGSAELLFFAIPNGIFGKGSHTHNDKLSFVLRVHGQEVFCDSGTGCYTRDLAVRNRFRSTAAHNALLIDRTEQNRIDASPRGTFILGNDAAVSPIQAGRDGQGYFLRASHTGYSSVGVTHTRSIRAAHGEHAFIIEDQLEGDGVHDFEINFQLAPHRNAELAANEDGVLCCIPGNPQVQLTVAGLQGAIQPSLVSSAYNVTVPAVKLRLWGRAAVPLRITTRVAWADVTDTADIAIPQHDSVEETKCYDAVAKGDYPT